MILKFPLNKRKMDFRATRSEASTRMGQQLAVADSTTANLTIRCTPTVEEEMSVKLTNAVWHLKIPLSEKMVLLALANHVNDNDIKKPCWPGIPLLSKECRISERQVQRNLKSLEKQSFIRREFRKDQSTYYHVLVTPMSPHSSKGVTPESLPPDTSVTSSGDTHVTQNRNLESERTLEDFPCENKEARKVTPELREMLDNLYRGMRA